LAQEAWIAHWQAIQRAAAANKPPPDAPGGAYTSRVLRNVLGKLRLRRGRRREVPLEETHGSPSAPEAAKRIEPEGLARLHPALRRAWQAFERHEDLAAAAALVVLSEAEVARRCAWALVHLEDTSQRLPRDAGVDPCWLDCQSSRMRRTVFALPAFGGRLRELLLRDTRRSPEAARKACERARRRFGSKNPRLAREKCPDWARMRK
jgi:hypothetical protein